MFARRGFNVQSLAVGTSEREGRSRITMVVPGGSDSLQNLIKQVQRAVVPMTLLLVSASSIHEHYTELCLLCTSCKLEFLACSSRKLEHARL